MKKLFFALLIAIATFLFTSCEQQIEPEYHPQYIDTTFTVQLMGSNWILCGEKKKYIIDVPEIDGSQFPQYFSLFVCAYCTDKKIQYTLPSMVDDKWAHYDYTIGHILLEVDRGYPKIDSVKVRMCGG